MINVEALVAKPIPELRPPEEITPEQAGDIISHLIYDAIGKRKRVRLLDIGTDRLGMLGNGRYLEKVALQKTTVDLMVDEFGLDLTDYTEHEELALDGTKYTVTHFRGNPNKLLFSKDLLFIRTIGHTSQGEESSLSWSASFPHLEAYR